MGFAKWICEKKCLETGKVLYRKTVYLSPRLGDESSLALPAVKDPQARLGREDTQKVIEALELDGPEDFYKYNIVIRARVNVCAYCGAELVSGYESYDSDDSPPPPDDNEAWESIRKDHCEGCEWVTTRAHRLNFRLCHENMQEWRNRQT